MIIIPDIHGRTYWKKAVEMAKENEEIIFLGDYIDPYESENITPEDALKNFEEIIEFRKGHSNVTLLLGNHDTEYFLNTPRCRCDIFNFKHISNLFLQNRELFEICKLKEFDCGKYLFSHSLLTKTWVDNNTEFFGEDCTLVQAVEKLRSANDDDLSKILGQVGYGRWGDSPSGSIVWSDMFDLGRHDWEKEEVIQICGHTQQRKLPVHTMGWFYMLDCREAFCLDEATGLVKCITNDECNKFAKFELPEWLRKSDEEDDEEDK